ncbi:MAG: HU family DNA-binding protein [Prevotella sp.]|nr:HU family DNA-binding protein [Prevotella sp.]MBQ9561555.1 HU family DNA-binding protein [Prevotella sp.]MBR1839599.1 HU family DNA-binding protein [Prevotella sp.]
MAIQVKVYQDNRKNSNKLFYGRAYHLNIINRDQLAERIQANCTVKKSDVVAVLTELVEVMNYELANSNKILLDGFGYFSVGVKTSGALDKEEWNVQENLKKFRVNFRPTMKRDAATGKITGKSLGYGYKATIIDLADKKKKQEEEGE